MTDNRIALYSHDLMVSQLYSLAGPQESLPMILSEVLDTDVDTIKKKLTGETTFSSEELDLISRRFHNSALQLSMIA